MNKILLFFLFPPFFFHSFSLSSHQKTKGKQLSLTKSAQLSLTKTTQQILQPQTKIRTKKKKKYIYIYIYREREREREREADLNQSDHMHRVLASRTKSMCPCLWKPSWSTIGTQKKGQNRSSKTTRSIWETLGEWSLMI